MVRISALAIVALASLLKAAELGNNDVSAWIGAQGGRAVANESGQIVEVDLSSTWITDSDLERIGKLTSLRKLNLANTKITDAGIEHLRSLPNVTELNLHFAEYISDSALAHIKNWKNLEILNLHGDRLTSGVFEHLAHLTNLRVLDIGFTEVEDDGFEQLAALTKLESLAIGGNRLSGTALSSLKLLPALQRLDVGGMQRVDSGRWGLALSNENLARLSELTGLKALTLTGANLNDRGIDRPGNKLAERTELTDLSKLRSLRNLEILDLSRTPVTASALASLREIGTLRELRLGLTPKVDDAAVDALVGLKQVKKLYVGGSKISSAAIDRFLTARPDCKVSWWQ